MFQLILLNGSDDPAAAVVSVIVFLSISVIGLAIYFLPTGIAMLRNHPNFMPIFLVNFLLGWICIGWIVALVWSVTAIDKDRTYR
jgi:T4 superinfection immunity protein